MLPSAVSDPIARSSCATEHGHGEEKHIGGKSRLDLPPTVPLQVDDLETSAGTMPDTNASISALRPHLPLAEARDATNRGNAYCGVRQCATLPTDNECASANVGLV